MSEIPNITIGGRAADRLFPIPELAPRQLREVRETIIALTDYLNGPEAMAGAEAQDGEKKETTGERFIKFTRTQYEQMLDVIFMGVTRGTPAMTREEFDNIPITDIQVFQAFLVVRRQSGLYTVTERPAAAPAVQEGQPAGEAPAAAAAE